MTMNAISTVTMLTNNIPTASNPNILFIIAISPSVPAEIE
jgi:hypothetical protein